MQRQGIEFTVDGAKESSRIDAEFQQEQVASYICDMTVSLKKLALEADLRFLAYLIDMAHIEAFNKMNSANSPNRKPVETRDIARTECQQKVPVTREPARDGRPESF